MNGRFTHKGKRAITISKEFFSKNILVLLINYLGSEKFVMGRVCYFLQRKTSSYFCIYIMIMKWG